MSKEDAIKEIKKILITTRLENDLREASLKFLEDGGDNNELLEMWTTCIAKIAVSALKEENIKNPARAAKDFGGIVEFAIVSFCDLVNEKRREYH